MFYIYSTILAIGNVPPNSLRSLRKSQLQFRSISALMSVGLAALPLFRDREFPPHPLSSVDYDDYRRERRCHWPSSVLCSLAVTVWKSCPVCVRQPTRPHVCACGSSRGSRMHSISLVVFSYFNVLIRLVF